MDRPAIDGAIEPVDPEETVETHAEEADETTGYGEEDVLEEPAGDGGPPEETGSAVPAEPTTEEENDGPGPRADGAGREAPARTETLLAGQEDMADRIRAAVGDAMAEALARIDSAMEERFGGFSETNAGFYEELNEGLKENFDSLAEAIPKLDEGEVGQVVAALNEVRQTLRVGSADSEEVGSAGSKEDEAPASGGGGRLAKWALAAAAPAFLVLGVLAQHEFGVTATVLGVDDTTRWKNYVWDNHGERIARCFDRARRSGVNVRCPVVVRAPKAPAR